MGQRRVGPCRLKVLAVLRKENRMNTRNPAPFSVPAWLFFPLTLAIGLFTAWAAQDRTKPTPPGNFHVTAKTAYTVTVAWTAPTDKSRPFNYYLAGGSGVTSVVIPQTATSHTFTGLNSGNEYWFSICAKDTAGNVSRQASVSARTAPETAGNASAPATVTVAN